MWEAVWRWMRQWFASEPEAAGGYTPHEQVAPQRLHKGAAQGIENGADNVQVGAACGDVNVNSHRHTQAIYHIYNVVEKKGAQEAPPVSKPPATQEPIKADATMPSSFEQHSALRRLEQVPNRIAILDFMEREFGTRMVIELKSAQLFRLNRYLDVVLQNAKDSQRKRSPQARKKSY